MGLSQRVCVYFLLPASIGLGQPKIAGPMPAKDGEICIVCYGRTTRNDLAYVVDGERYAVMKGLEADFLKDPSGYISRYKAEQAKQRGAQVADEYLYGGLGALVVILGVVFWLRDRAARRRAMEEA